MHAFETPHPSARPLRFESPPPMDASYLTATAPAAPVQITTAPARLSRPSVRRRPGTGSDGVAPG